MLSWLNERKSVNITYYIYWHNRQRSKYVNISMNKQQLQQTILQYFNIFSYWKIIISELRKKKKKKSLKQLGREETP